MRRSPLPGSEVPRYLLGVHGAMSIVRERDAVHSPRYLLGYMGRSPFSGSGVLRTFLYTLWECRAARSPLAREKQEMYRAFSPTLCRSAEGRALCRGAGCPRQLIPPRRLQAARKSLLIIATFYILTLTFYKFQRNF